MTSLFLKSMLQPSHIYQCGEHNTLAEAVDKYRSKDIIVRGRESTVAKQPICKVYNFHTSRSARV